MGDNEYEEYAKKFLKIIDVVEKYQYYMVRRTTGLLYLTIAATISIFLFLTLYILELVPASLKAITFVPLLMLIFAAIWFISANILKLPKIYQIGKREDEAAERGIGYTWFGLSLLYVLIMILNFIIHLPQFILPLYTQVFVALGNLGNYYFGKRTEQYPGKINREYLYFAIILLLTSPMITIFRGYEWFIVTIFTLLGTYAFGVYIVLTSDKALE